MFIQVNSSEVYHQDILSLLGQIKIFLLSNQEIKGSEALLAKVDKYIKNALNKQSINNEKIKMQQIQQTIYQKSVQIESTSKSHIIQPRQFSNLIDVFVLEYNIIDNNYKIVTESANQENNKVSQVIGNDRKAIFQLVLGSIKEHVSEKQKTNSMTELHKLTSNVPKFIPPLILPNYTNQYEKYTYIYETKQCIERRKNYYLVDRYYCFVTDGLATHAINQLCRKVKNRVYENRLSNADPFNVNHKTIKVSLQKALNDLLPEVKQNKLASCVHSQHEWIQKVVTFQIEELKMPLFCSLLTLITYLAICEFKIVLTVSKNEKYKLSDVALSMEGSLGILKYIYPVVFCCLTKDHCDFVESPVPLLIGFWGSQKRRTKFIYQLQHYLDQHQRSKGLPTAAIDLQNLKISATVGITIEDVFVIQKLHNHILLHKKGKFLWEKIASFIKWVIQNRNGKAEEEEEKQEWVSLLQKKIINCQMFQQLVI